MPPFLSQPTPFMQHFLSPPPICPFSLFSIPPSYRFTANRFIRNLILVTLQLIKVAKEDNTLLVLDPLLDFLHKNRVE